jgi:hypothetical protein
MPVTFVNHDDTAYILLLISNPSNFIVIIFITQKLDLVLKAFYLLCFWIFTFLKLLQSFFSESAFAFQLSSKIAKFIEREGFAEVEPISILIVIRLLR